MSPMTRRRPLAEDQANTVNRELADELSAAGAKAFTGAIEVIDRGTRNRARLYLYEGGVYAVDLEGYQRPVYARLRSSGAFALRSDAELAVLAGLDVPDPAALAQAVDNGWLSVEALAGVHQELLLAALGGVLALAKVKTRPREGETTARFCTLPLPVDPLFETVRIRARRLQGTWAILAPGTPAGTAVLSRTPTALDACVAPIELPAMARELDGRRSLDEVAWSLGFTRAEAAHVAAALINSGLARVEVDAPAAPAPAHHLVPESFGARGVEPVGPVRMLPLHSVPEPPAPVPVPADRSCDDGDERVVERARAEVERLHTEFQAAVRMEQEAINHTADMSDRLRDARVTLATLEMAEAAASGII